MTKRVLAVGDRVRVYDRYRFALPLKGTVVELAAPEHRGVRVKLDKNSHGRLDEWHNNGIWLDPAQCRHLIRKPKPQKERGERVVRWISGLAGEGAYVCHKNSVSLGEPIRLVECSELETPVSREALIEAWDKSAAFYEKETNQINALCDALGFPEAKS